MNNYLSEDEHQITENNLIPSGEINIHIIPWQYYSPQLIIIKKKFYHFMARYDVM